MMAKISHLFLVFLTVIYTVSCQGVSLTFVVDDSLSMLNDIEEIRQEVESIMNLVLNKPGQFSNIILVTFNDPGATLKIITKSREEMNEAFSSVKLSNHHNYDCPEMALTGVKLALESSLPGSYIYVYTDASAKDYYLSEEIQKLCQKKQSQVVFVQTGDCKNPNSKQFRVYNDIATACSESAFTVPKPAVAAVRNDTKLD